MKRNTNQGRINRPCLIDRIRTTVVENRLLKPEETVVVGVSGGPDSMALLHLLHDLDMGLHLVAVYIDHCLRPAETEEEKQLVKEWATRLGAEFFSRRVDTPVLTQQERTSTEEAARMGRYRALEAIREMVHARVIGVGHTADDQAEELLLRLIRGSGRAGLSGMKWQRDHLIRPLLGERKKDLIDYLRNHNIPFCQDSSNRDQTFVRNRVRLDLLPHLEAHYNPAIKKTLRQTATILQDEESLLDQLSHESFNRVVTLETDQQRGRSAILDRSAFNQCHRAIQRRILETLCHTLDCKPTFPIIQNLLKQIQMGTNSTTIHLKQGLRAMIQNNTVLLTRPIGHGPHRGSLALFPNLYQIIQETGEIPFPELNRTLSLTLRNTCSDQLPPTTLAVDAARITFPLILRHHRPGERFTPLGAPGRKKVGRFLTDRKIPLSRRPLYPVLCSGESIIALLGLRIDHQYRLTEQTDSILLILWTETISLQALSNRNRKQG